MYHGGPDKYRVELYRAVLQFAKLDIIFTGYFDPEDVFLIMKKINCRGALTDVSAKTKTLAERSIEKRTLDETMSTTGKDQWLF